MHLTFHRNHNLKRPRSFFSDNHKSGLLIKSKDGHKLLTDVVKILLLPWRKRQCLGRAEW